MALQTQEDPWSTILMSVINEEMVNGRLAQEQAGALRLARTSSITPYKESIEYSLQSMQWLLCDKARAGGWRMGPLSPSNQSNG